MRISDWSSDVCSSDLFPGREIEASVGRQAQSVILTDLGEEGGIPAITLYIGVVFETPDIEGKARTERKRIFADGHGGDWLDIRSEEHTSELQSLMRISYAVFCLKKKTDSKLHEIRENHKKTQKQY